METTIDYLSFTIPFEEVYTCPNHMLGATVERVTNAYMGEMIDALLDNQPFTVGRPRPPYQVRWGRGDGGVSIFASTSQANILIEITGKGCKTLREHNALEGVLRLCASRCTRLDVACDMEVKTTPHEFAQQRDVKRFKTTSDMRSFTGDTFYVGSFHSDRFARVYRFNDPHPRSHLLRVEHVYRRDLAKELAKQILAHPMSDIVAGMGLSFGWTHPNWQPNNVAVAEVVRQQTRKTSKDTIRWLYGTVTNSVIKQVERGQLDLEDFIAHLRKQVACTIVDSATITR